MVRNLRQFAFIWIVAAAALTSVTPVFVSTARAQQSLDWELCHGNIKDASLDLRLRACTEVIQTGRESQQNLADAHLNRGFMYRQKNDLDQSLADFDDAIRLDPQNYDAFSARTELYHTKGDDTAARHDYEQAMRIDPVEGTRMYNQCLASLYSTIRFLGVNSPSDDEKRMQERLWTCTKAAWYGQSQGDSSDQVIAVRGWTHFKLGQFDAAIEDYDSALKYNPKRTTALYGRGLAKRAKGDQAGGDSDVAAARAIQPDIAEEILSRVFCSRFCLEHARDK
jgi:tetratricopeptide (TPR) repeat protein